jgi:hypothetical protein
MSSPCRSDPFGTAIGQAFGSPARLVAEQVAAFAFAGESIGIGLAASGPVVEVI